MCCPGCLEAFWGPGHVMNLGALAKQLLWERWALIVKARADCHFCPPHLAALRTCVCAHTVMYTNSGSQSFQDLSTDFFSDFQPLQKAAVWH